MNGLRRKLRTTWTRIRATKGLGRDLAIIAGLVVLASASRRLHPFPPTGLVPLAGEGQLPGRLRGGARRRSRAGPGGPHRRRAGGGDHQGRHHRRRAGPAHAVAQEAYGTVYANARAFLRPKSQLNEMYVFLDPGGKPAKVLEPGSVIPLAQTTRPIQLDEVLSNLDDRARTAGRIALEESDVALARPGAIPP